MSKAGVIRYFRNNDDYSLPSLRRSKYGYMCIKGMKYGINGVVRCDIEPTEYQCPETGRLLPLEERENHSAGGWQPNCEAPI